MNSLIESILHAIFGTPKVREADVEAILMAKAAANPEKLDWRNSIVDLLKLLDVDSSYAARKRLARELGYSGTTEDSAQMNIWLHQAVLTTIASNGGQVPFAWFKGGPA